MGSDLAVLLDEARESLRVFSRTASGRTLIDADVLARLVEIAAAVVEMRRGAERLLRYHDKCGMVSSHGTACAEGIAAFDAACAGEGK